MSTHALYDIATRPSRMDVALVGGRSDVLSAGSDPNDQINVRSRSRRWPKMPSTEDVVA